jgi:hypothetical protein
VIAESVSAGVPREQEVIEQQVSIAGSSTAFTSPRERGEVSLPRRSDHLGLV